MNSTFTTESLRTVGVRCLYSLWLCLGVAELGDLVKTHENWRLHQAINLQASENIMSAEARSFLSTDFAHRYTLPEDLVPGLTGLKNAYRGTKHTDAMEALSERYARERSEEHTSELQSPCNLVCRL